MILRVLVGTYSHSFLGVPADGRGIYGLKFDTRDGTASPARLATPCRNPSYLARHPARPIVYAVNEVFAGDGPAVKSYAIDADGRLARQSRQPIAGELPCQLSVDPSGRWLATAQYWSGDVALFPLAEDGTLKPCVAQLRQQASGPNRERQEGPHAHCTVFSDGGRSLHVCDLGADAVYSYALPASAGTPVPGEPLLCRMPAGCGPRHLALMADERFAVVSCELDETVCLLERTGNGWAVRQVVAAFDRSDGAAGTVAAIRVAPDGRHVYVSGRRQSAIACFSVDDKTHALSRLSEADSGGTTPRDIILTPDGKWLLAANQESGSLGILGRDEATGLLSPVSSVSGFGNPVALLVV